MLRDSLERSNELQSLWSISMNCLKQINLIEKNNNDLKHNVHNNINAYLHYLKGASKNTHWK